MAHRDAGHVVEQRSRGESSFTFVIDARVLCAVFDVARRFVARDLLIPVLIPLIAHKEQPRSGGNDNCQPAMGHEEGELAGEDT